MRLVLASTSPARRELLARAGLSVAFEAPGVDEDHDAPDPVHRAIALARRKAAAVAARNPDATVLGADQVVHDGLEVFGKPRDPADHLERLLAMRGRTHDLVTGWALVGPHGETTGHDVTRMHVRADLTRDDLAAYVACGEGTYCAGGYAAEGRGMFLFERIEGDFFNVLGLPVLPILGALRGLGWRFGGGA